MNCPKCSTPAAAGASHCKRCGNPLTAKAAAASTSMPDEIDLMPLEESKTPSYSPYEPPPELGGPPPAAPAPGTKVRPKPDGPPPPSSFRRDDAGDDKGSKTTLMISGAILALFVLFIGWRIIRPRHEIKTGKAKFESSAILQPNQVRVEDLEVVGSVTYKLEVTAMDSDISYGVFKRAPKDSRNLAVVKKLPEGFDTASKGDPATKTGELKEGTWSWILINEGKKPARVKFKFAAE